MLLPKTRALIASYLDYRMKKVSTTLRKLALLTIVRLMMLTGIIFIALCMTVAFETAMIFPLDISLAIFTVLVILSLGMIKLSRFSLLTRAIIVVYALPFVHIYEHLWADDTTQRTMIWGLTANPYNQNPEIIKMLIMIGNIGLLGIVMGYSIVHLYGKSKVSQPIDKKSLSLAGFITIALLSLFFSWLYAPEKTIISAAYTETVSLLTRLGINFNAAWLVSYVFASLMFIDIYAERDNQLRKVKVCIGIVCTLIIIVWFQLMRGDREFIGLAAALIALYLVNAKKLNSRRLLVVCVVAVVIFATAQVVGSIRSVMSSNESGMLKQTVISMKTGTWTASLLTPLSVVGDYYYGLMDQKWGETYLEIMLSTPPGVITQLAGIERPIEGTHGPAWEMRYGIGGTHATVVPFMNFKSYGVLGIMLLYGLFIGTVERRLAISPRVMTQLLYATLIIIAPFWFWYGEMNLIRALMAFYITWWAYKLLPKLNILPERSVEAASVEYTITDVCEGQR